MLRMLSRNSTVARLKESAFPLKCQRDAVTSIATLRALAAFDTDLTPSRFRHHVADSDPEVAVVVLDLAPAQGDATVVAVTGLTELNIV